ncbi:hypothetical protein D3C78_706800 [compost metagenome]
MPKPRKLLPGEVHVAVVARHDLGEQLVRRPQNAWHPHADKGVITHEAGKFQMLRISTNQTEHLSQRGSVRHTTAMQADVQFNVHPQPRPQPLGQGQVLLHVLGCVEQPLQLPRRVERTFVQAIEKLGRANRQRLAQQDVGSGKPLRVMIEKGLMKRHQSLRARALADVGQQLRRRQGFLHQTQLFAAALDRLHHHVDVVIEPFQVNQQQRAHRAVALQFLVQGAKVIAVGAATVTGPQ